MPTSTCRLEPDIAVTWEVLLVHAKYRGGHSQPAIELSTGSPMGEQQKGPKELKGLAAPQEEQQFEPSSTPRAPTNQRQPIVGPINLVAYAAEDGLAGHQREERPLILGRLSAAV